MSRLNALLVCGLLALATATGAYAVLSTVRISHAAAKPQAASPGALAKRAKALAAWSRSLDRALHARPPQLPRVPRYAPVPRVSAPPPAPAPPASARTVASVIATVRAAPKPAAPPPTTTLASAPPVVVAAPPVAAAPPPQESDDGEGGDG